MTQFKVGLLSQNLPRRIEENQEHFSERSRSPRRNSIPGSPTYTAGVTTTRSQRSWRQLDVLKGMKSLPRFDAGVLCCDAVWICRYRYKCLKGIY
jgi:hypothetical protein